MPRKRSFSNETLLNIIAAKQHVPSLRTLRELLGSGSFTTIRRALKHLDPQIKEIIAERDANEFLNYLM